MNPKRALTRLSSRITRYEDTVKGGGSSISWDDVAGAMPKDTLQSLMIRVKWTGQHQFWEDLVWWASRELWPESWNTEDPRRIQRLVELALRDWADPGLCHRCGGHEVDGRTVIRTRNKKQPVRSCPTCQGTGIRRARSGRSCARLLGIDEKTWREIWRDRFQQLEVSLNTLESKALKTLQKNLEEEKDDSQQKNILTTPAK
ncbi:MAG: zinc finger-like domain-containing protein [Magnetococcales bacterium]|nr:zinc finger-like domain-containing protein [Magnetococcales bacterium]MBF0150347.1 zinc finger-like domain-containing protein [Magnetococcales bacterium]MBF0632141.1 zinc finger-like domain-containing protein [Magnetococcales bacterium]